LVSVISLGSPAPDFTSDTTRGEAFTFSSLRGSPVALYFYPKAFTPGCTMETRRFQSVYPQIRELGAELVGVSHDALDDQCRFAEELQVGFRLVSDLTRKIIDLYGVAWPIIKLAKRVTFIIDADFKIVGFHQHELLIGRHSDDVLTALKRLKNPKKP
jgi:thioredoxin-dependent peroxiredoxin